MAKNKDQEFKDFLISTRKKIRPGLTNAPVWVLQKAGKRIWNPKRKKSRFKRNTRLGYSQSTIFQSQAGQERH